jgi:hypothetical protein
VKTTNKKNSIENYFSMSKSRLQKLEGLKYENLKENKEKYENTSTVLMKDQKNMSQGI